MTGQVSEAQQQRTLEVLKRAFPDGVRDRYKSDFIFTKRGSIREQEAYKRRVDEAVKKDAEYIISFCNKPSPADLMGGHQWEF